jgi:hypothetical protein
MRNHMLAGAASACALSLAAPSAAFASGASASAWVSRLGADAAGCGSLGAPCRSLQYAHDNIVVSGGSIFIEDSGGFGQIVIRNPISIVNVSSGTAKIDAPSGDGIDVESSATTGTILIKGMTINGAGTGTYGINLTQGSDIVIADCVVVGFGNVEKLSGGIIIQPQGSKTTYSITNTQLSNNPYTGIWINPGAFSSKQGSASGVISNVRLSGSYYGIFNDMNSTTAGGTMLVTDSVISNVQFSGVEASGVSPTDGSVYARFVSVTGSPQAYGFYNLATMYIANSTAIGNGTDVVNGAGDSLTSYGGNIYGSSSGTISTLSQK